jgi:hypothetical protein
VTDNQPLARRPSSRPASPVVASAHASFANVETSIVRLGTIALACSAIAELTSASEGRRTQLERRRAGAPRCGRPGDERDGLPAAVVAGAAACMAARSASRKARPPRRATSSSTRSRIRECACQRPNRAAVRAHLAVVCMTAQRPVSRRWHRCLMGRIVEAVWEPQVPPAKAAKLHRLSRHAAPEDSAALAR